MGYFLSLNLFPFLAQFISHTPTMENLFLFINLNYLLCNVCNWSIVNLYFYNYRGQKRIVTLPWSIHMYDLFQWGRIGSIQQRGSLLLLSMIYMMNSFSIGRLNYAESAIWERFDSALENVHSKLGMLFRVHSSNCRNNHKLLNLNSTVFVLGYTL